MPGSAAPSPDIQPVVISIDALGAEKGLAAVVGGMAKSAQKNPAIRFVVHGPEAELKKLLARKGDLARRCEIRDVDKTVSMEDKPSQAVRHGRDTSMWHALDTVARGEATVAVSCGNTGALMGMAMLRLRKTPGVDRPAIAVMWPSRNPAGFNVMLDVGADIRAEPRDLLNFAVMGASYARNALALKRPRVGLLNVGTEDHKGRPELRQAAQMIGEAAEQDDFEYVGFVEGGDIFGTRCDLVVTDGFTGNAVLKTAEGTAALIGDLLRDAFRHTPLSRLGALFALTSLKRLSKRIDPRRKNGGVFLGLNGTVVKSHGAADATGISAAIKLAFILAQHGFTEKLAARVASSSGAVQDAPQQHEAEAG